MTSMYSYFDGVPQQPEALWQAPYLSTDDPATHYDMHNICWWWGCFVGWSFIYLFAKFYYDNYVKRGDKSRAKIE